MTMSLRASALVLVTAFAFSGTGCGSFQNFLGTYKGTVASEFQSTSPQSTSLTEKWVITSPDKSWPSKTNHDIRRTRESEADCSLQAIFNGGYDMDITSGTTCALSGGTATLERGSITEDGESTFRIRLEWSWTDGSRSERLVESGVLSRQ